MPKPDEQKGGPPPPKLVGQPPTISGPTPPKVGDTLTASDGEWSTGPNTFVRQWLADGWDIEGAESNTYVATDDDVGKMIRVEVAAVGKGGTSEPITSEGVGPVEPAEVKPPVEPPPIDPDAHPEHPIVIPPEPGPEPPPSGDAPPSITDPVTGTPLTHVYALKDGGTGARDTSYPNGKWTGEIDAFLASLGFVRGNYDNALYCDAGDADLLVEGYDFNGVPRINWMGRKRLTVRDCRYIGGGSNQKNPTWPCDGNNNIQMGGSTLEMFHEFCEFDVTCAYQGCAVTVFDHCKMTNQEQGFCDISGVADTMTSVEYIDCFIPGGGVKPAWAAHVELMRWASEPNPAKFARWTRCMVDISACGQADAANYGGGWTGVWSIGDVLAEFLDCVQIGAPKVNASPTVPNSVGCVVAFGERHGQPGPKLTNCVTEPGCYGYGYNHSGGSTTTMVDGGGNRTFANELMPSNAFGSITRAEAESINPVLAKLFDHLKDR